MSRKEIAKIKLTLTTRCNHRCVYCFVKKTGETMSFGVARKSVEMLINSPGKKKLLEIFGGELFLEMELFKKIVIYARSLSKKRQKQLTISIATNLTVLTDDLIGFIDKNGIKLSVTLVGPAKWHDKYRVFAGGAGTYDTVVRNLKRLRKKVSQKNIGVSYVVIPSISNEIYENFKHVLDLGVSDNINFEIVQQFEKWTLKDRRSFFRCYRKVALDTVKSIESRHPIFLNSLNWEIGQGSISELNSVYCPMKNLLQVYPSGEMAFDPFLLNRDDRSDYVIGNISERMPGRYEGCAFDKGRQECGRCALEYFRKVKNNDNASLVRNYYDKVNRELAELIIRKAKDNRYYKAYISDIKKHRCF